MFRLKEFYPEAFSGLDENTFNRWVHGRTSPSLYKKLLIYTALDISIISIFKNEHHDSSAKELKVIESYLEKIDQKLLFGGYVSYSSTSKVVSEKLPKEIFRREFDIFYMNNSAYINIRNSMDKEKHHYALNVIKAISDNTKVGHIVYSDKIDLFTMNALKIEESEYSNHMCVLPMYYMDSEILKKLISEFIFKIIDSGLYKTKHKGLFLVSNPMSAQFFESALKSKLVKYYPPLKGANKHDKGLYLYEVDLIYMMSIPYIFNLVKKKYETHFE